MNKGLKSTNQVERQSFHALAAHRQLQQLLGQAAQQQQRHQGQWDAEAQQSQQAALAARPPVTGAGHSAGVEVRRRRS